MLIVPECGPASGKKKACKNCTCGLADELDGTEAGKKSAPKAAASACGNVRTLLVIVEPPVI